MVPAPNRVLPTLPLPQSLSIKAIARRPACGFQAANSPPQGREKWFAPPQNAVFCAIAALLSAITQNTHFAPFFAAFGRRRAPAQPRSLPPRGSPRCRLRRPAARSPSARGRTVGRGWAAPRAPPPARPQSCRRRAQPCPSRPLLPRSPPAALVPRPGLVPPDDVLPVTLARDRQHVKIKSNLAVAP